MQVPVSLRNMIGRSFATEDAHDKIRAHIIDLFEVIECEAEANLEQVCTCARRCNLFLRATVAILR